MKTSIFVWLLPLLFYSCAKTEYVIVQSVGQIELLTSARDNGWVLEDEKIPSEQKEKIRDIQSFKKYFQELWGVKTGGIYSKTTFLEQNAVTYLLIRSPHNRVGSVDECFPVQGCFPYIGFFDLEDAKQWESEVSGQHRYIRPVYAYSTLGWLDDPILSSFFQYERYELAELIFHELFHTMFFVESEVELNENLANYFGKKMAESYFRENEEVSEKFLQKKRREKLYKASLASNISQLGIRLDKRYKKAEKQQNAPLTEDQSQKLLSSFLKKIFLPQMEEICEKYEIAREECGPLHREWNNASLAAFKTYNKRQNEIRLLRESLDVDYRELFVYIQKAYRHYRENELADEGEMTFADFLFSEKARKKVVMTNQK